MLLLSIDTCGASGTVALARLNGEELDLLALTDLPGKTYSAQLVPTIVDLLGARHASAARLGAIVVASGPGSFTGIRIGLSTAKGLAEAHSIPIVAVSRLAVLAHKAKTPAAAFDASRHEYYVLDDSVEPHERLVDEDAFAALAAALGPQLAVCELAVLAGAASATLVAPPTAADALAAALPRVRGREFDDPVMLDGNYLRRSDAEIFAKARSSY